MSQLANPPHRHRRWLVTGVLALAVVTGLIAILSTWVKRQALDTGNWTDTSSQLLADPHIQDAVGAYLVNTLFTQVDVAEQLRSTLPQQAQGLAGPASAGLRELANRAAPRVLARPRVQDAWELANKTAHQELMRILNGGGKTVSTANGEVVLDLRALVTQLATTLGIKLPQRSGSQPDNAGQIVIMRSNELGTAQDVAKGIRNLSIVFTVLSFALFILAVWLARGWRRVALRTTGWCFAGLGFFTLVVRRFAGNSIVDNLVQAESVKPAAHDVWLIGTSLLRAIALAFVIYGLVIVAAAWLAGPTRPALALRRALTPTLRDHPVRTYGAAAFVYLLVILWGPTPALRHVVPILLIAALLVLGIELLRRQAARDFPEAHAGDAARGIRAWLDARRGRAPAAAAKPSAPRGGNGARLEQLERLASLHDSGALTDEEYDAEKGVLLRS